MQISKDASRPPRKVLENLDYFGQIVDGIGRIFAEGYRIWATRLADYLCRHTDVPKDIATHRLARADGLGVHLVQPLLFQHVGTYSVILHHEKNPANVVSAGFSVD